VQAAKRAALQHLASEEAGWEERHGVSEFG
jgi:hypothetical protein